MCLQRRFNHEHESHFRSERDKFALFDRSKRGTNTVS